MAVEIKVPTVGESINEVTLSRWMVSDGDYVELDDVLCELESDKATFELSAEDNGKLEIVVEEGTDIKIGDVVCKIDTSVKAPAKKKEPVAEEAAAEEKAAEPAAMAETDGAPKTDTPPPTQKAPTYATGHPSPAAAKMMKESGISPGAINGTGTGGRITKGDVLALMENGGRGTFSRETRREKMSRLRRTIGDHLVAAKNTTAMLTTFNEVNMGPIMELRKQYKEKFAEKHGVGLGFMSFFTKACCTALQEMPSVNAIIDGEELVYHDYCDISIAVSTPRGLVVPNVRNAESLSMAEIEMKIKELALAGRDNKLGLEDLEGGTFTISNGGVFGSLMSTPILNSPQSAILGMHKIEERPMVVNGEIIVKPMMYLAMSYDHRVIDGKESVTFLVRVKELLENPSDMLLGKDPVEMLLDI
ncbi:MAG: 2-oxoglutarate dehydrogenase complex dihydrolipoyllysine-residue succinyltransferase [Bacteroidetes bacterium]|nr:2-oxoglutarate dehydrogenase complex dihydrolipoyllysine-residue succinyltransferase [Bacteroidota bacterium]